MADENSWKKCSLSAVLAAPLVAILLVSIVTTPAYASWVTATDPEGDFTGLAPDSNADFDIKEIGITDDGNLKMTVFGTPGGTIPEDHHLVYGYVFFTDVGIVAVTSHSAEDSHQVEDDLEWHSHLVELDGLCVESLQDFGKASIVNHHLQSLQTGATTLDGAATVQLTIDHMGTHDDPSDDTVCITGVWDTA